MAKNVMKLLKPSPHRARHDFDLSHRHLFDANFGELLPATCIETVPGDNITLNVSDLLRNIPLITSPYLRAKQHFDVWFVPYRDLWHNFDQFITQKEEPVSAALGKSLYLPHTSVYNLSNAVTTYGSVPYSQTDAVGRGIKDRSYYLLQLLGYGDLSTIGASTVNYAKVNLFRLAAYNYIWYNEYRQQYYDDGKRNFGISTINNPQAHLFNFDDLLCSTEATADLIQSGQFDLQRLAAMCQMRYRCWKKDLFTGLLPSNQFGVVSTVSVSWNQNQVFAIENTSLQSANNTAQVIASSRRLADSAGNGGWNLVQSTAGSASSGSVDILSLRKSEAVQVWRENALRAGNHVKDNMMAHYGVASDFQDHRPTYLGSVSSPINISDVLSTAATDAVNPNNVVGAIAGKGTSSMDEHVFKFHAKEFGVIMVMFSILPEGEYEATGIERTNQLLESEDFFIPEYENLGLEAVGLFNLGNGNQGVSKNIVVGYAPRYYGYKTKLDKVFGEFCGVGVFRQWASQRNDLQTYLDNFSSNVFTMPISCLYVNPNVFNGLYVLTVDNSPQFMCDVYFDVDAVRPMSVTGLPFS